MGNCKDCRFWGDVYRLWQLNDAATEYVVAYESATHHVCNRMRHVEPEEEDITPKLESNDDATFTTPALFGCVLFEAK